MANEENLREPWKPGQSGNPNGRPVGSVSMRTLLRQMLASGELGDAKRLWAAQFEKSLTGDTAAAKFVVESMDGLLSQTVIQQVNDGDLIVKAAETVEQMFGPERVGEFLETLKAKTNNQ